MSRTEGMTDTGAAREGDTPTLAAGSRRFVTRRTAWLVILATALVTTVVVNIMTGPAGLSLAQVANGFLHPDALEPGLYVILWDVRLPFALMAVAVAFTGVIGFVGLIGPHIARLALGEDHRFFLPGSALAGAVILSGASLIGKSLVPGVLIPDGIVTALIGIPLFLGLLMSQKRRG